MKTLNSHCYMLALGILSVSCTTTGRRPVFQEEADVPPLISSDVQTDDGVTAITSSVLADWDEASPVVIDKDRVAFLSDSSDRFGIWYMDYGNANTRTVSELVNTGSKEKSPFVATPGGGGTAKCYFVSNSNGDFQVFSGSLPKVRSQSWTVDSPGDANWPHLSPDGSKLLYSVVNSNGDYGLWIHGMNGGGDRQLFVGQRARFNPANDEEFVFVRKDGDTWNIWKLEADGALNKLVPGAFDKFDPEFSPDGRFIAYTSNKSGSSDIWVMEADGSRHTLVTADGAVDCQPTWALDGESLLFSSNRSGSFDIFSVSVSDFVGDTIEASTPTTGS